MISLHLKNSHLGRQMMDEATRSGEGEFDLREYISKLSLTN